MSTYQYQIGYKVDVHNKGLLFHKGDKLFKIKTGHAFIKLRNNGGGISRAKTITYASASKPIAESYWLGHQFMPCGGHKCYKKQQLVIYRINNNRISPKTISLKNIANVSSKYRPKLYALLQTLLIISYVITIIYTSTLTLPLLSILLLMACETLIVVMLSYIACYYFVLTPKLSYPNYDCNTCTLIMQLNLLLKAEKMDFDQEDDNKYTGNSLACMNNIETTTTRQYKKMLRLADHYVDKYEKKPSSSLDDKQRSRLMDLTIQRMLYDAIWFKNWEKKFKENNGFGESILSMLAKFEVVRYDQVRTIQIIDQALGSDCTLILIGYLYPMLETAKN